MKRAVLDDVELEYELLGRGEPKRIAMLGKSMGPPWGKDQKDAALAAMVALAGP